MINILRNEQTCVKAADACDRDCGSCPLVKPTEDILEAYETAIRMLESPSAQYVLTCNGCRHIGTYDTDFPCNGCVRREKDYYEPE